MLASGLAAVGVGKRFGGFNVCLVLWLDPTQPDFARIRPSLPHNPSNWMTETEWLACDNACIKLLLIRDDVSIRQLRLIAAAYARRLQEMQENASAKRCDDILELVADRPQDRSDAYRVLFKRPGHSAFAGVLNPHNIYSPAHREIEMALRLLFSAFETQTKHYGLQIIHEVVGNPFRPVAFNPQWRTSTVLAMARGMYESRDFSAMPILADALQDAGCENTDILNHCRDEKASHIRGCWVVDMVLDKSGPGCAGLVIQPAQFTQPPKE
jgi:hypothetical protein